jgi:transcriptional regulator of NAD metabolism
MSDEHIERLQSSMQFHPTRLPKIVLQRVEEEFPAWKEIIVSNVAMCRQKNYIILRIGMAQTNKKFSKNFMLPLILCGLRF